MYKFVGALFPMAFFYTISFLNKDKSTANVT